jgi:hypothetical protein
MMWKCNNNNNIYKIQNTSFCRLNEQTTGESKTSSKVSRENKEGNGVCYIFIVWPPELGDVGH